MSRNLRHQLRRLVFDGFSEHINKHAVKREKMGDKLVFSYNQKKALLSVIDNFCKDKSLPRNPELLEPDYVRSFLDKKALEGCSQATLDTYRSNLIKIGKMMGKDLDPGHVYAQSARDTHRGAEDIISHDDLAKIIAYGIEHPSRSALCIRLEAEIGIRVSDMAYGIHVQEDALSIQCKGGKWLERSITPKVRDIIEDELFQSMIRPDGKVDAPKDNSLNKYLRRVEDSLGLERHSFHSIRRRIAQDKYNELRIAGRSRSQALSETSIWLNHGPNREKMLLKSYISDAW